MHMLATGTHAHVGNWKAGLSQKEELGIKWLTGGPFGFLASLKRAGA